jgi:DNA-binding NarL/FixJ family response regulator
MATTSWVPDVRLLPVVETDPGAHRGSGRTPLVFHSRLIRGVVVESDAVFIYLHSETATVLIQARSHPEASDDAAHVLLECQQEVMTGGAPMSPPVANRVIALFRDVRSPAHAEHHLTPHEVRLLGMLAEGHSYKTAAAALGSSVHTVAFHMKHIYAKLQVHSKSEAVAKALRHRIVR